MLYNFRSSIDFAFDIVHVVVVEYYVRVVVTYVPTMLNAHLF